MVKGTDNFLFRLFEALSFEVDYWINDIIARDFSLFVFATLVCSL